MISEQELYEAWRQLFYHRDITESQLAEGEALIDGMKPESPLRRRFERELEDFREMHRREAEEVAKAAEAESRRAAKEAAKQAAQYAKSTARQAAAEARAVERAQHATERAQYGAGSNGASRPRPPLPSQAAILARVAAGEITAEEAARLLSEAETRRGNLYCRVSEKGALSVYGLQRMPVTLYCQQWDRLLEFEEDLRQFIADHQAELKRKE